MAVQYAKRRKVFSYEEQKIQKHRIRRGVLWILGVFLAYVIVNTYIFSIVRVNTASMEPGTRPGDCYIALSYGLYHSLPAKPAFLGPTLYRGQTVVIERDWEKTSAGDVLLNTLERFFTAGRGNFKGVASKRFLKRIIGLPGDTVSIASDVARVKPAGDPYTYTEFELTSNKRRVYNVTIPQSGPLWDQTMPFSGNMKSVTLGKGEYFVLSDDRSNTNDSRTWGAVKMSEIQSKLLFRYWPLTRIGAAP
jgi:signal peptidase I